MKNFFSKKNGFTLLEVMVIIAIIGIMSAVGIVSLSSSRKMMALKASQDEVASAIKLAQSYALQGRINSGTKPDGYGFEFAGGDDKTYRIFAYTVSPASQATIETKELKNGVTKFSPIDANTRIEFQGDYAIINLFSVPPVVITLQSSGASPTTKTVTINAQGFITQN